MKDNKITYLLIAVIICLAANYWYKQQHGISLLDKIRGKQPENPVIEQPSETTPSEQAIEAANMVDVVEVPDEQPTGTVWMTEIPNESKSSTGKILSVSDKTRITAGLALSNKILSTEVKSPALAVKQAVPMEAATRLTKLTLK